LCFFKGYQLKGATLHNLIQTCIHMLLAHIAEYVRAPVTLWPLKEQPYECYDNLASHKFCTPIHLDGTVLNNNGFLVTLKSSRFSPRWNYIRFIRNVMATVLAIVWYGSGIHWYSGKLCWLYVWRIVLVAD
jgi:hypothetical protein